jgi:hypothetical protein
MEFWPQNFSMSRFKIIFLNILNFKSLSLIKDYFKIKIAKNNWSSKPTLFSKQKHVLNKNS